MAITPKDLISGVVERGRKVVSGATGRFRRDHDDEPATTPESPAPTPRAGGTKTGASTPGTTRTQRTREAGTSTRKPTPKAGTKGAPKSGTAAKPTAGTAAKPKAGTVSAAKSPASKPTTAAKPKAGTASASKPTTAAQPRAGTASASKS